MINGTINGTAAINLTGAAMTWGSGTIGGSGTLTIPSGTVITVSGYISYDTRPITNNGTINYTLTYYSYLSNNAVITNNGTIDLQGDNGLYQSGPVGTTAIVNNNIFKKKIGRASCRERVHFTAQSGSQLLEQSGTLNMADVTSTSSAFS